MRLTRILLGLVLCASPVLAQGGFLGVSVDPEFEGGARVLGVNEDTAAAFAGLREGDVIVRVGRAAVDNAGALVEVIGDRRPGDLVSLTIVRGDAQRVQKCILGRRPGDAAPQLRDAFVDAIDEVEEEPPSRGFFFDRTEGGEIPAGGRVMSFEELPEEHRARIEAFLAEQGVEGGAEHFVMQYSEEPPEWIEAEEIEEVIEEPILLEEIVELPAARGALRGLGYVGEGHGEGHGHHGHEHGEAHGGEHGEAHGDRHGEAHGEGHGGRWHPTLEHALGAARESGKPVLLDFSAEWCGPCKQLGKEVLHNERYAGLLSRYEAVMVDIDEKPKLAEHYDVQGIPDVRILAPGGEQIGRQVGYRGVEGTVEWLQEHAGAPRRGNVEREETSERNLERMQLLRQREELMKAIQEARVELESLRAELRQIER